MYMFVLPFSPQLETSRTMDGGYTAREGEEEEEEEEEAAEADCEGDCALPSMYHSWCDR